MKATAFLDKLDHEAIVTAIAAAEKKTSGEIRVYISHRKIADALTAARARFEALEMHRTHKRNAVMIYIAPRTKAFAIVGDAGIHAKCGDEFWRQTVEMLGRDLQFEPPTIAIVNAVRHIGALLAAHFPPKPGDTNELPNAILSD